MLRIAIQAKGRLNEESVELLAEAGVSIEESKRKAADALRRFSARSAVPARRRHSAGRFDGRCRRRNRRSQRSGRERVRRKNRPKARIRQMPHFARHPESRRVRRDRLFQRQTGGDVLPRHPVAFFQGKRDQRGDPRDRRLGRDRSVGRDGRRHLRYRQAPAARW